MKKCFVWILFLVYFLSGCSLPVERKSEERPIVENERSNITNEITMEEALQIVRNDVDGEVVKKRENYDDGLHFYEIELVKDNLKYEYKITMGGKIIGRDEEIISQGVVDEAYITPQEAQEELIQYAGGGVVISCEFEYEGKAIYEIELVKNQQEYNAGVDAITKEVLYYHADN